ncbi:MAG: alpha-amylase [Eubacterium sp.]|nr:alpha-amylase [Eubacterium sp.]
MKKSRKSICAVICVLLCALLGISGCSGKQETAGGSESAVFSVQMLDYNKALEPGTWDDNYRTTYEIFVYSFCDSNGDGIGDINGIRSKLDYIKDLGFTAIWLTPVHPSQTYHKYDVDDYYSIDPAFGTIEDYEAFLSECHDRGIEVYMDLVLNHTSDDNQWFKEAAAYFEQLPEGWDPDPSYCKYCDYYNFTRQPGDGYAPLEGTEWYYEARFWNEMPDLNLESEAVRGEIRDIMTFWLGKGVDGFRLDAVTSYKTGDPAKNTEILRSIVNMGRSIDPGCYFVAEAWTDRNEIAQYYSSNIDSLFNFPFSNNEGFIAKIISGSYKASDYVKGMLLAEEAYGAANPNFVDAPFYTNHDMGRSAGYYTNDEGPITKMAYAMSLFQTGNSFVYYGEEIGMKGAGKDENKRAPMYWSDDANDPDMCAGPPEMDAVKMKFPSLKDQMEDDMSLYTWFREVIKVRNAFPQIARGKTEGVDTISDDNVAAFYRRHKAIGDLLIVMNLRGETVEKDLSGLGELELAAVLNTNEESITFEGGKLTLPAYSISVFTVE